MHNTLRLHAWHDTVYFLWMSINAPRLNQGAALKGRGAANHSVKLIMSRLAIIRRIDGFAQ